MDSHSHELSKSDFAVSPEFTLYAPDAHYNNPGPTPNLRGVEENTARTKGETNTVPTDCVAPDHGSMVAVDQYATGPHFRVWEN